MRFSRDEYLSLMTFGDFPRPMFTELFGPLIGLPEEWRAQGATEEEIDLTAFDWDYVEVYGLAAATGAVGGKERVVIEDNDEYRIERDGFGRTLKLAKKVATIPLPLDFPVKTMDDWLKLKPLFTWSPGRINWGNLQGAAAAQQAGKLTVAHIPGAFDVARELMGEELACMAYYDQPELMHDVVDTLRTTATRVLAEVAREVRIDQLSVHEDFAGKSGPLIGPSQIAEYLQPHYREAWDICREAGARIFCLDTDGNINSVVDALLDCGLTSIHPMEPAAGMDIVQLRAKYGTRLAMRGGIDKHVLRQGKAAIRAELEYKLQPAMREVGGIAFSLDHRIPNGTPIENYRYYVDLGREILGLPPRDPSRKGWRRMAF